MTERRTGISERLKTFTAIFARRGENVTETRVGFSRLGETAQQTGFHALQSQEPPVRNTVKSTTVAEAPGPARNHQPHADNQAPVYRHEKAQTIARFTSPKQSPNHGISSADNTGTTTVDADISTDDTALPGPSTVAEILAQFTEEELSAATTEGSRIAAQHWERHGLGGNKEPGKRFVYDSDYLTSISGQKQNMSTLREVTTGKADEAKEIIVNGQSISVDSGTASRLEAAIKQTKDSVADGLVIDCFAFSTLLCGQTWGDGKTGIASVDVDETSEYVPLEQAKPSMFEALKPILLVQVDKNGLEDVKKRHVVVQLSTTTPSGETLYAHKLGRRGPIAINTLAEAGRFYQSNQIAHLKAITVKDQTSQVLFTRTF
jgi:hypothetical protein